MAAGQVAIQPQNNHYHVASVARQQLVKVVEQMTNIAYQPHEVIHPEPWDNLIQGLSLCNDGLRCLGTLGSGQKCEKGLCSVVTIHSYCKREHG